MSDPRRSRRGPPQIALPGTALCPVVRCGQPCRHGGTLCTDCTRDVAHMLDPDWFGDPGAPGEPASIPVLWAALDLEPSRTGAGRRAPGFHSMPPLDLDAAVMRDRRSVGWPVVSVWFELVPGTNWPVLDAPHFEDAVPARSVVKALEGLADAVWDEIGYPDLWGRLDGGRDLWPATPPARDVEQHCHWLHTHRDHLTAREDAGAIHDDLTDLREQLRRATGDVDEEPVGRCQGLISVQGQRERVPCRAPLYLPPPRPGQDDDPKQPVMRCGSCDRPYTHLELLRMELVGAAR